MKYRLFFSILLISNTALAQTWDLASDFATANQNGSVWELGYFSGTNSFNQFTVYSNNLSTSGLLPTWWTGVAGNWPTGAEILLNNTSNSAYGISPNNVSLESDSGIPVAQFIAPYTSSYNIDIQIGGTTAYQNGGFGNYNANLAGLLINSNSISGTFNNNIASWVLNDVQLSQGETIDLFVGQRLEGGNTNTQFTVQSAAVPVPNAAWLFVSSLLGILTLKNRSYRV